jgi:hypothetical protein
MRAKRRNRLVECRIPVVGTIFAEIAAVNGLAQRKEFRVQGGGGQGKPLDCKVDHRGC